MKNYLLSMVCNAEGTMVSVHANAGGLERLIDSLTRLRQLVLDGQCEDLHLFSDHSLGGELTSTKLGDSDCEAVNVLHCKVYGWTNEWAERHNLLEQ